MIRNVDTRETGIHRALLLMRVLRVGLLVACLVTAGVAWALGSRTIVALAVVIAAEEAWETSVVVAALRHHLQATQRS